MSVPKQRQTSSRSKKRRSHHGLDTVQLGVCSECKTAIKPHHACSKCGAYAGRSVK